MRLIADDLRHDRPVQLAVGAVFVGLALAAWLLFAGGGAGQNQHFTHLHCPLCRNEVPYSGRLVGNVCSECAKGTYVPTVGSIWDGAQAPSLLGRMVTFFLLLAVLVPGVALLAVHRLKVQRARAQAFRNRVVICHCPYCRRKIGFPAAKAGSAGVCRRCKTAFVFPEPEGE